MKHSVIAFLLAALIIGVGAGTAIAGEQEDLARVLMDKNKQAVVTVQLTVKTQMAFMGMDGQEEESKVEVTGTVISPEGLTVVALSATDPMSMLGNMFGDSMEQMQMSSRVTDAKILRDDGSETPARVALRDKDLDLAFVQPVEKPSQPVSCIPMEPQGSAQVFDTLVTLTRLGKVANRAYAASFTRIQAVVTKPRTYYVPTLETLNAQGSPAFLLDGNMVGIVVLRTIKGSSSDAMGGLASMFTGGGIVGNMTPIILPASDILEVAKQAPDFGEAVAEEPAPEAPAKEGVELAPEPADATSEQH